MRMNLRTVSLAIGLTVSTYPFAASAEPPTIKTPTPVIYLVDNLDEIEKLGWCIDTIGRGLSEKLHAHTCKPTGGDVQFKFNTATGQIASAAFKGKCAEVVDVLNTSIPFGLLDCTDGKGSQKFSYNPKTREFHSLGDASTCITVAATSRNAGPFMSRDLKLEKCAKVAPKFKQWIIKP